MNAPEFDSAALTRLKRMISGSRVDEVLDLYLQMTPLRVLSVRNGLRNQDLERVGRALHDIKSSAGMVGALQVERLALEMEQGMARLDRAALEAKLHELSEAVDVAQRWVADHGRGR